jgi:hypothetical protein
MVLAKLSIEIKLGPSIRPMGAIERNGVALNAPIKRKYVPD